MRLVAIAALFLTPALVFAAQVQKSPQLLEWQAQARMHQSAHAEQWAQRGDARSLIKALMLGFPDLNNAAAERRTAWAESLRDMPIVDPEHAWWFHGDCRSRGTDCNAEESLHILAEADPDNLWTLLILAKDAHGAGREAEALELLVAAAQAKQASSHSRTAKLIREAWEGLTLPEPGAIVGAELGRTADGSAGIVFDAELSRLVVMTGLLAAHAIPEMSSLTSLCKPGMQAMVDPAWQRACIDVAGRIGREDPSLIGAQLGLTLAVKLTEESVESATWREQLRHHLYRYAMYAEAFTELEADVGALADYLRDVFEYGELAALQRYAESRGLAFDPSADWLPDNERSRSLILTGAEPPA